MSDPLHTFDSACSAAEASNASDFPRDYAELAGHLDARGLFRMNPGVENLRKVLGRLNLPRPSFTVAQVVGTNGKGSTSTMLASLAQRHGLATGLYTSPHFVTPRERIRINGRMLSEEDWTRAARAVMREGGMELTYFELLTAMAVWLFAEAGVTFAVLEAGLGGSFDATTALAADAVLFTPVGLDHQNVLGPTLAHIARDKAGAVRSGVPVFTAPQEAEALKILETAAAEKGAPLFRSESTGLPEVLENGALSLSLAGGHQKTNARLALAAWRHMAETLRIDAGDSLSQAEGLAAAWLPGRMQFVPAGNGLPNLLLDGAHNAHGLAALGHSLAREGIAPAAVVFSCLADKDPEKILPHLRVLSHGPVFVPPVKDNPRAAKPEELAALIGLNAVPVASLAEALEAACAHLRGRVPEAFEGGLPKNPLLLCGSLYLLGEFFETRPELLERETPGQHGE